MSLPCANRTSEMYARPGELLRVWRKRSKVLINTLCSSCPAKARCYEMGKDEPWGIWGGTTPDDRGYNYDGRKKRPAGNK